MNTKVINNTTNNYVLVLWGGPWLPLFSKYWQYFKNKRRNYILFENYDQVSVKRYITYILETVKKEEINIETIIWFSFWAYIWIRLLSLLPLVKDVVFISFLYSFRQLEEAYWTEFYNKYVLENTLSDEYLRVYINKNLELAGYSDLCSKEWEKLQESDRDQSLLQLYFEKNSYFEDKVSEVENNYSSVNFTFVVGKRDLLTPESNICEFIEKNRVKNYIIRKHCKGHSFSEYLKNLES